LNVFDHVNHAEISEAMNITTKAGYKFKRAKPERYRLIALAILADRVHLDELLIALDTITKIHTLKRIKKLEANL